MNTLTNLAISNNKANKTRSILIIISILLTTLLLTVIASWGYGIVKYNKVNADVMYGSYYGSCRKVTEEQLRQMELRSEFSEVGKMAYVGQIDNEVNMSLYMSDENTRRMTNQDKQLWEGAFPLSGNEITAQKSFFEKLGYSDAKIGQNIVIPYRRDEASKFQEETFQIAGFLKENERQTDSYAGFVSESYYEQLTADGNRVYNVYFRLDESISVKADTAEEEFERLAEECGIDTKGISKNNGYLMWSLNPGTETVMVCSVIILMVIFFSAAVIYNIFQVGIKQKIWEYGKIKAMGATKKQLKSIILKEGMVLAAIGIPLGILSGYLVSVLSFDGLLGEMQTVNHINGLKSVSLFSPLLLLLVVMLSLLTVWIALKKPMKIVASISTVDAMRYQEGGKKKKGMRKGKHQIGLRSLTLASLSGNRKRSIATIFTMGVSCVLFVVMVNFLGNMDAEYDARLYVEHGQFSVSLNYKLRDEAYPENNLDHILTQNPLNGELLSKIKEIDKVTEIKTRKLAAVRMEDGSLEGLSILSRDDFDKFAKADTAIGALDYDEMVKQGGIVYGWPHTIKSGGLSVGDTISFEISNGTDNKSFQGRLMGAAYIGPSWCMAEETFEKLGLGGELTGEIWIDCRKEDADAVEMALNQLLDGIGHVELETYADALESSEMSMKMLKVGVYAFLILIGVIAFMNMANTMITSIITRKQEFGVLQAVGMTKNQLNYMLQMEGLIFTAGTVLIALAAGIPLGYAFFLYGRGSGMIGLHIYHFPWMEIIIMILVFAALQLTLSFILSRNIKKESIVERIRYQG